MITPEAFAQLQQDIKELDHMREQVKELRARSMVCAYTASVGRSRGGHSDRVFDRVAKLDELEREVQNRRWELLSAIQRPIFGYCNGDDLPNARRVWDMLRRRCDGETWETIGAAYGIKSGTCRFIVRQYEKRLKKQAETEEW